MDDSLSTALASLRQRVRSLRSNRLRPSPSLTVTLAIEQGHLCWFCSMPSPIGVIVPLFSKLLGGMADRRNFVHACSACALDAADLDPLDWARSTGKKWTARHAAARSAVMARRKGTRREDEACARVAAVVNRDADHCLVALPQLASRRRTVRSHAAEQCRTTLLTAHGATEVADDVLSLPLPTVEKTLAEGARFGGLWLLGQSELPHPAPLGTVPVRSPPPEASSDSYEPFWERVSPPHGT